MSHRTKATTATSLTRLSNSMMVGNILSHINKPTNTAVTGCHHLTLKGEAKGMIDQSARRNGLQMISTGVGLGQGPRVVSRNSTCPLHRRHLILVSTRSRRECCSTSGQIVSSRTRPILRVRAVSAVLQRSLSLADGEADPSSSRRQQTCGMVAMYHPTCKPLNCCRNQEVHPIMARHLACADSAIIMVNGTKGEDGTVTSHVGTSQGLHRCRGHFPKALITTDSVITTIRQVPLEGHQIGSGGLQTWDPHRLQVCPQISQETADSFLRICQTRALPLSCGEVHRRRHGGCPRPHQSSLPLPTFYPPVLPQ